MTNENNTPEETVVPLVDKIKNTVRTLPWKKIAIAAAVTTVAALVVVNKDKLGGQSYEIEFTGETDSDGNAEVILTPITD